MGRDKKLFGKVIKNHLGYNIRQMTKKKTDEKTKDVTLLHTGKYGVYAGKKLVNEFSKIQDAIDHVTEMVNKKIKQK